MSEVINNILGNFLMGCGVDNHINPYQISLSILKGGKSKAQLYQFMINELCYVLRILPENANQFTREHQILLARLAGEMKVGPKVCYIDPQFNGIILDYIPGRETQPKDFQNLALIDKMAQVLRALHKSNRIFPMAVSPFKRLNDFLQKDICQNKQLNEMKTWMKKIEQTLKFHPVSLSPTHLDLHLSNIILKDNDNIFFVDWVNGGLSDPYFDLATFSYFAELNNIQTEKLLTSYFQRAPNEVEWARFKIIKPVRLMVIAASFSSNALYKRDCSVYIEKSMELIESEIFISSLKFLQDFCFSS